MVDIQTTYKVSVTQAEIYKEKIFDVVKDVNFVKDSYTQNFFILVDIKTIQFEGNLTTHFLVLNLIIIIN